MKEAAKMFAELHHVAEEAEIGTRHHTSDMFMLFTKF